MPVSEILLAILIIMLITLLIAFNARAMISFFKKKTISPLRIEEAEAIIINIQRTGIYINNLPEVKLQMQVIPKKDRNFVAEIKEPISSSNLKSYSRGNKIKVLYKKGRHQRIQLIR